MFSRNCLAPVLLAALAIPTVPDAHATERVTSPNQNGGSGQIPSGYTRVVFNVSDGNHVRDIQLPAHPRHGYVVEVGSHATFASRLAARSTVYDIDHIPVENGTRWVFRWDDTTRRWSPAEGVQELHAPNQPEYHMPTPTARMVYLYVGDGYHASRIRLPPRAADGTLLAVQTKATWASSILPDHVQFASTLRLQRGDVYAFRYSTAAGTWQLTRAPQREQPATAPLSAPTSPRTLVNLSNGNWGATQTLPSQAGDRDRFVVRSTASSASNIASGRFASPGPRRLERGDEYEFMYAADSQSWHMTRHPTRTVRMDQLDRGQLTAAAVPVTRVTAWNGNHQWELKLPTAEVGARVVLDTQADYVITVIADGLSNRVDKGELASFKVAASGAWERETHTIDILSLYSDRVADRLGESAARARLVEGMALTNEGLENSGANFRFRQVGLRRYPSPSNWKTLGDALSQLRDAAMAQQWRNELKADGIYYEGTEDGCGLAYVRSSNYNMVATGTLHCGTTVMRHELGHNMGLSHGPGPVPNIMAGNALPYFSTPSRFTAEGLPMRNPGEMDGVQVMNAFAPTVASYR